MWWMGRGKAVARDLPLTVCVLKKKQLLIFLTLQLLRRVTFGCSGGFGSLEIQRGDDS
jgi:hypothetical protein